MKTAIRIVTMLMCVALLLGALSACNNSGSGGDGKVFKVAYVGPMTGDFSQYGISMQLGVQMAVEQWNNAGGVNGWKCEVIEYDDKNDAKESVVVTQKAIEEGIVCALGPFASTCGFAMSPLLIKAEIIHYAISCSHPDITKQSEWVFRGTSMNNMDAYPYADLARDRGCKTLGVVYTNNDWGNAVKDFFIQRVAGNGGEVVIAESYIEGQTKDFSPQISKILNENVDAIFLASFYNDAASILTELQKYDYKGLVMGTGSITNEAFLPLVGAAGEGFISGLVFSMDSENENFQQFAKDYTERTGRSIDFSCIIAYDSAASFLHCVSQVGEPDRHKVREALENLKDYEGCNGKWSFDSERNPMRPQIRVQVQDGQWVILDTYEFVEA